MCVCFDSCPFVNITRNLYPGEQLENSHANQPNFSHCMPTMSKVLRLYNSFTRSINEVKLGGKLVSTPSRTSERINGSFYICGPTVYSDSHLGHAITYTRADLFRQFMKSIFNVNLTTVMNITDIDDKILAKALEEEQAKLTANTHSGDTQNHVDVSLSSMPSKHPFKAVSERYHEAFLNDMKLIRVEPPDISIKVSHQIGLIVNYIQKLEKSGHAYIATNGDIYFRVASVANYVGRTDARLDSAPSSGSPGEESKQDKRDFVLWKAAKLNEPVWHYKSCVTGQEVPGRPGWHVQCSAISSAIFGNQLDFHFGGKDLIFPHHYNEQACCCAYHNLDTTSNFHVWSSNWLHAGHLVLREEKMSKSLGNVVSIRDFINSTSVNALRLICIDSHYRADINLDDDLLRGMQALDHKISAFTNYLSEEMRRLASESSVQLGSDEGVSLDESICQAHEAMLEGICDDFDLGRGLQALLDLSKRVYNLGASHLQARDLVALWHLLMDWCEMCSLEYKPLERSHDDKLVSIVQDFRQKVRLLAVDELKRIKNQGGADFTPSATNQAFLKSLLDSCDKVRSQMDESGYVLRDGKT